MKIGHFRLAYKMAQSESALTFLQARFDGGDSSLPVDAEIRRLQGIIAGILSRSDHEEILAALPAAKEYLRQEEARREALEKTLLGRLIECFDLWSAALAEGSQPQAEVIGENLKLDPIGSMEWPDLVSGVNVSGRNHEIVQALRGVLGSVLADLISTSLPPPPALPDFED